ncbi:hypothetical protein MMC13_003341 [Lambiella insularis]|nr:hypothetical protein [Lambiella insularis]
MLSSSGRRAATNRIRGPQSALTDFLASNNISAVQIRDDYERRRQAVQQQDTQNGGTIDAVVEDEVEVDEDEEDVETAEQKKRRKKREEAALARIKKSKAYQKRKGRVDDEPDGDDDEIAWDMYAKSKPLPGQLEHCEKCDKRFTVTAYSKEGPDGGLLCPKCSKEQEAERKKDAKPKKQAANRDKRRKIQSNLLDGIVHVGSKTLQELCVEKVADNINDVDEFGDLPDSLLDRLSQILSKRRVITTRTLDLFLRSDLSTVAIYDCGKLEVSDYIRIFSIVPKIEKLDLRNAGQFKDEVLDYILERDVPIRHLQLEAANLVSDAKWRELFAKAGLRIETLKLSWLDYSMDDETVAQLVHGCPNLKRLKMKKCFRIGDAALEALSELKRLEHLSLQLTTPTTADALKGLVRSVGAKLRTLSLEKFDNADDEVLQEICLNCDRLTKLRFTANDYCTDKAFRALFTDWRNPPLVQIDFSSNRDLDYSKPDGPEDPIGLASSGFLALMAHSGSKLQRLDISSCRHITQETFSEVFDGIKQYPFLKDVNISFLTKIDTVIVAGMFKSCPSMAKLTAFGCFNITDIVVPLGVALIGVPNALETIVQEGDFMGEWPDVKAML